LDLEKYSHEKIECYTRMYGSQPNEGSQATRTHGGKQTMQIQSSEDMDIERPWTFSAAFDMNGKKMCDVCGIHATKLFPLIVHSQLGVHYRIFQPNESSIQNSKCLQLKVNYTYTFHFLLYAYYYFFLGVLYVLYCLHFLRYNIFLV
jgi:hypothetical protein